jgi:hypothetical protein
VVSVGLETTTVPTTLTPRTGPRVTAVFLAHLPRFLAHARFAFRRVGCPHARADRVAETVALAWKHFAALAARGKKPEQFVTTLALRCSQAVKAGRRLWQSGSALSGCRVPGRASQGLRAPACDLHCGRPRVGCRKPR